MSSPAGGSLLGSYRRTLLDITSLSLDGRLPGTRGDRLVEEYLISRLEGLGLEVRVESYEARGWIARWWRVELEQDGRWERLPAVPMARTGPARVALEGGLAWAGDLHREDLEGVEGMIAAGTLEFPSLDLGLLAMASLYTSDPEGDLQASSEGKPAVFMTRLHPSECGCPVDPEGYEAASKRGALAVLAVLQNYPDMGCGEFTYYAPSDGQFRPLPGFWLPRGAGKELEEAARERRRVRVELEAWSGPVEGRNIVAVIPGRSDEVVLVHSHHDAPYTGAVQDASGVAMVLELARHYAARQETPRRTLMFLLAEGHFDSGSGQTALLQAHPDLREKIVVDIAIEHIAREYAPGPHGVIRPTGRPEPRAIFVSEDRRELVKTFTMALSRARPRATLLLPTGTPLGVPSDANRLWRAGVPVASLISGPVYMFSSCDTPEKVDYGSVEPLFNTFRLAIEELAYK